MLKEKNYLKAEQIVLAKPTGKLTMDQQADLIAELSIAKEAYEKQAALTKEHYKTIYEPMCALKAELEIKMHELQIRVDQLTAGNPAAEAMVKLVLKKISAKK